ncbi:MULTISPECIES: hypothetical protein [unclassified Endozoicomonas]|uniref:hypothetical protein n=1 Tax=unclassified Endozoicomonas TaxID=2644528 RepID=UPI002147CC5B|nr:MULTISPECIES: hypothetical protein [unclassified Endozoicomonas]
MLLLLLSLLASSVVCQAELFTERFLDEFEQKTGSPNQSFSIKRDRHTLSDSPTYIADTNGYAGLDSPPDNKRKRSCGCNTKTPLIESVSWQWLQVTHLLIGYQLILTTRDAPLGTTSYPWLPIGVVVAIGWLLKSDWKPDSPLFDSIERLNLIQQQGASQNHPLEVIATMPAPEQGQPQYQLPESSGQQAPEATYRPIGYFTRLLYSDPDDGNEGPQPNLHTLGLDCFVHPCHGVCSFRPPSGSGESAELHCERSDASIKTPESMPEIETAQSGTPGQSSCPHLADEHCFNCVSHFDPAKASQSREKSLFALLSELTDEQFPYHYDQLFESEPDDSTGNPANSCNYIDEFAAGGVASTPENTFSTANGFEFIHGPLDSCSLLEEAGFSPTPINTLTSVKTSETQSITTESHQSDQCQPSLFQTSASETLSEHKNNTRESVCDVTVVGREGRQPCGVRCRNPQSLSSHKSRYHTGQKICDLTVIGKYGKQQRCGLLCENARILTDHKRKEHSGKQTCDRVVIAKNGQTRSCGKIFKNAQSLSSHKTKYHPGQRTCKTIVFWKNGQPRRCGMVCWGAKTSSEHKKTHRERKPDHTDQDDDL